MLSPIEVPECTVVSSSVNNQIFLSVVDAPEIAALFPLKSYTVRESFLYLVATLVKEAGDE